jgi:hypothetical protein
LSRKVYKYFSIDAQPRKKGQKTDVFDIVNREGVQLGQIKWNGKWRQYCLFTNDTIWSIRCLDDITDFLQELKEEREKKRKPKCVYASGSGDQCAHSLSKFYGKKTSGDRKKEPCNNCKYFKDKWDEDMSAIKGRVNRGLRQAGRSLDELTGKLQEKVTKPKRPRSGPKKEKL